MALEEFKDAMFPLVAVKFNGTNQMVRLRELTQAQLYACGGSELSLIETFQDKIRMKAKPTMAEIIQYASVQNQIVKRALVKPTYQEIFDICKTGFDTEAYKKLIDEAEEALESIPMGPKYSALEEELDSYRIWVDLILPQDFMASIVCYTFGIDKSDIKDVTEQALLNAAIMAERGHDNPADHLKGLFTDFMKDDINRRAWIILNEKKKEEKNGG